ncbi:MAG: hypothetical protein R6V62_08315 [Candidatus Fermentibacteraceae bacterium]
MITGFLIALLVSGVTGEDMVGFWHSIDCIPAGVGEALFLFPDGAYYYHVQSGLSCIMGATGSWSLVNDGMDLELRERNLVYTEYRDGEWGFGICPSPGNPVVVFPFNGEIVASEEERPFVTDAVSLTFWKLMADPSEALSWYVSPELYQVLFGNGD